MTTATTSAGHPKKNPTATPATTAVAAAATRRASRRGGRTSVSGSDSDTTGAAPAVGRTRNARSDRAAPSPTRPVESEDDFQAFVTETATTYGWKWAHFRKAKVRGDRWATPQSGDPGFPDLVLSRDGVVLVVELKSDKGGFRPGQKEWLAALGPRGRLWRPRDKQAVIDELKPRRHK